MTLWSPFTSLITPKSLHISLQSLTLINTHSRHKRHFIAEGNASSSTPLPMPLETQMTLALLQELLMALRANDAAC